MNVSKRIGGCVEDHSKRFANDQMMRGLKSGPRSNVLHKMHLDGWDCRGTILSRARLGDTPTLQARRFPALCFWKDMVEVVLHYVVVLVGCINGLGEVQHGLNRSELQISGDG